MLALEIRQLFKKYPKGPEAIKGIDLSVEAGDFFGLLGPNGAGKSTTIGVISSLVNKTSGQVKIFEKDLVQCSSDVKPLIGLVPQEFNFNFFETVLDILVNQAGYYGIPRNQALKNSKKYLKKLGLWEKAYAPAKTLSGGMKRRLMIARALVHEPQLLILDEPTAGVDIEARRSMWAFFQEMNANGVTIILTTHYLEEAEHLCKNIAIIDRGEIIEHTTVKDLIRKLNKETIILDLQKPIFEVPDLPGFSISQVDALTLEVSFLKPNPLNVLFEALSKVGGEVVSLRNKSNRLEELFLDLVKPKAEEKPP